MKNALKFCIQYVKKELDLEIAEIDILEKKGIPPTLYIVIPPNLKSTKNILVYGYLDKQPALKKEWSEGLSPWIPKIDKEKYHLYGRGGASNGYNFFMTTAIIKAM